MGFFKSEEQKRAEIDAKRAKSPGLWGNSSSAPSKAKAKKASETQDHANRKEQQQAKAKMKNVGKTRSTEWPSTEIPRGYKSVKTWGGKYKIVKK